LNFLIKNGANVNANNDSALRNASSNGHLALVEYLISNGADIHACDDQALHLASQYGHLDVVKIIKKYN
jgi:ankyrin repeat protein